MKILKALTTIGLLTGALLFADEDAAPAIPERGGEGTVTIITNPPGSKVYLDAEELGETPIVKKPFASGRHDLVIIEEGRDDYELVNTRFNVWPNKENKYEIDTKMPMGHLEIKTKHNCQISIDGDYAGEVEGLGVGATFTMRNVRAIDHQISLACGRKKFDTTVTIPKEATLKLELGN